MKNNHFFLTYLLLLVLQILICNYLHLSLYLTLTILPVMIILVPIRFSCTFAMLLAFASGMCVDFLSEGIIGLNAMALVPVALFRKSIVKLVFGSEIFARKEDISIKKHGIGKMSVAIIMAQSLFLLIYIWADGAGMRPLTFCLIKFIVSLFCGWILSIIFSNILTTNSRDI